MPEYGVCFPPVLLEGVICSAAKRFLPCKRPLGKAGFAVISVSSLLQKHGFSGLVALDLGREGGGRKEVMQNTCSAASAADEGGLDFSFRAAESELSCQHVAHWLSEKCWIGALTRAKLYCSLTTIPDIQYNFMMAI